MANKTYALSVIINAAGAVAGAKVVNQQLKSIGVTATGVQKLLNKVFAATTIAYGVGQTVKVISGFEQQMATLKAVLSDTSETGEITAKQFNTLRDSALEMGLTSRFTAEQAAEGMTILAKAGFSASESMEAVTGTLQLAQAGAIGMGHAADIMTSILRGFNMATSQSGEVVDILTRAANASNADVTDFGQAMKFVAPIASGVNMSLGDTVALLEALSNAGLKGSMAGTGLRRVIGALEGPNATQIKQLKQLGLSIEDVKVSAHGLPAVMAKIGEKTNDVGKFLAMFGQRGGPASKVMQDHAKAIEDYIEQNKEAEGAGLKMANIMNDNLAGAIDRVRASFQVLIIKLGDVGATTAFRNMLENTANVIRFLARNAHSLTEALKVLGVGFFLAYGMSQKFVLSLNTLKAAMLANPATVWIAALTALSAAIVLFRDQLYLGGNGLATFGDLATAVGEQIWEFRATIIEAVTGVADTTQFSFRELVGNVLTFLLAMFDTLLKGFDYVGGTINGIFAVIVARFNHLTKAIAYGINVAMTTVVRIFGPVLNWMIDRWNDVAAVFGRPLIPNFDVEAVIAGIGDTSRLKGEMEVAGEEVGKAFSMAWENQMTNGLSAGLNKAFDRANELAIIRAGEREEKMPASKAEPKDTNIFGPPELGGKRGKQGPTFGKWLADLQRETELLKLNSREYEIQNQLFQMYDHLGGKVNDTQWRIAEAALRENQVRQEQARLYDEIQKPHEDLMARQEALNGLFNEGRITVLQFNEALDKLRITALSLKTDLQSGLERGLLQVKEELRNVADVASSTVVNAFKGAENMLVEFTTTGKLNFSQFVDGVLQDVTRLMLRQAFFNLFKGAMGWAAPNLDTDNTYFGARGLDMVVPGSGAVDSKRLNLAVTPGERVIVQTPQQQKAAAAQQGGSMSVKIVNLTDPNDVPAAMEGAQGEKVILNIISRNRNAVRGAIG